MCSTVTLTQSNQRHWVVPPQSYQLLIGSGRIPQSVLGTSGGTRPPQSPPPWLRHWWTWCCQTFHKISWQLERLSIGLVVLCAVAAVAWSPSAARSLSWSATVRTSCAAVCGLVCSHNDCQQYRIIFVDADTVWVIFTCSLASYSLTLINSFPMATFGVTSYRVNSNYILG